MAKKMLEGSRAVAEAAALCRPQVISAYPITPQTHIVQELAQMVADGEVEAEFVNVESEHSAASVLLGASATGVRVYSSTTSQGLLLMNEVLYNISGLRFPVVLTCTNRAISAPLNIWNDQQDSYSVRDSGWIQFYAENNQEAVDFLFMAYRVAEDHRVMLPAMVCMDGYILSHAYEAVDLPTSDEVDAFLPPYKPLYTLDPERPLTFGTYAEPDKYMETRYMLHRAMEKALAVIQEVAQAFQEAFGRPSGGLLEEYRTQDATTLIVGMGSMMATVKATVDLLREEGQRVGALKVIAHRPFPAQALYRALRQAERVLVIEKAISLGSGGPLATEIRALFQGRPQSPQISGAIAGLGGRDITVETVTGAVEEAQRRVLETEFLDLRPDLELEGVD